MTRSVRRSRAEQADRGPGRAWCPFQFSSHTGLLPSSEGRAHARGGTSQRAWAPGGCGRWEAQRWPAEWPQPSVHVLAPRTNTVLSDDGLEAI